MKALILSCLLSLAVAVGTARAEGRWQQGGGSVQQQAAPRPSAPPPVHVAAPQPAPVRQSPRPDPVRMSPRVVHTLPEVRQRPPMVTAKPSPGVSAHQNFVGGSRSFRHFPTDGNYHPFPGDRNRGFYGHGFHHHGFRSNYVIVYVNGAPFWYPFYTAYPYYYDAPLAPTYDSGSYDSGTTSVPYVDEGAGGGNAQVTPSYGDLGQQWAQDLRREVATWDDFVDYVKNYIIVAAPDAQAEFREAFIASYGINGAAAYDKAASEAAQAATQGQ